MLRTMPCCGALVLFAAIAAGENRLWVENGEALPGTARVTLRLLATHDEPLNAFTAALNYDIDALEFLKASFDGAGIITGESNYEYGQVQHDPVLGDVIIAVLMDFEQPYDWHAIPASPTEAQTLAKLDFKVKADADPGQYGIRPRNALGTPPISNAFTINRGLTETPRVDAAVFSVLNPFHMYVIDTKAVVGGMAVVTIEAEHQDPIGGYTVSLRYPSDLLIIDVEPLDDPNIPPPDDPYGADDYSDPDICKWPITWCGLGLETPLGSAGIDSFRAWVENDYAYDVTVPGEGNGWVYSDAIFDFDPRDAPPLGRTLSAGRQKILQIKFKLADTVTLGQEIPLTLVNTRGTVDVYNMLVVPIAAGHPVSVRPDLHAGTITIVDGFKRAHINADGQANLADVIYLLTYLFAHGPEPVCMKAADISDDGALDIGDAITFLTYLFKHGTPPKPPFSSCGPDPTPDNLTCAAPAGC